MAETSTAVSQKAAVPLRHARLRLFVFFFCLSLMQGVHESKGVTDDYLRLESLIQKVVSPYLGTHGLYSRDESSNLHCSACLLGLCMF